MQKEAKNFPFKLEDGEIGPTMTVSWRNEERHLAPEEVSAMVLTEMKGGLPAAMIAAPTVRPIMLLYPVAVAFDDLQGGAGGGDDADP